MGMNRQQLERAARAEADAVLRELPGPLQEQAAGIPITVENFPSNELLDDGVAPDTMGLFIGEAFPDPGSAEPLPPQIILFLDNLWEEAEHDLNRFRQEVRTTVLHELGHYLGLDEDDLEERGLE